MANFWGNNFFLVFLGKMAKRAEKLVKNSVFDKDFVGFAAVRGFDKKLSKSSRYTPLKWGGFSFRAFTIENCLKKKPKKLNFSTF